MREGNEHHCIKYEVNVADVLRTIVRPEERMQQLGKNGGDEYDRDLPFGRFASSPGKKCQDCNKCILQQEADLDEQEF